MIAIRGETELTIGGARYVLCLTLGALAEIESLFGCRSLAELQARLKQLSANELLQVLAILLRAGGRPANVSSVKPADAARAVAEAFHAALG